MLCMQQILLGVMLPFVGGYVVNPQLDCGHQFQISAWMVEVEVCWWQLDVWVGRAHH